MSESTEERIAKLRAYGASADYVPVEDREDPKGLPRWVKMALVFRALYDESWETAARRHSKAGQTLERYGKSPAGKKWLSALEGLSDSPVQLAELVLKGNAIDMALEYLHIYETAKAAGDYKECRLIIQDWMNRAGVQSTNQAELRDFKPTIVINLPAGPTLASVEIPMPEGEAVFQRVVEAQLLPETTGGGS